MPWKETRVVDAKMMMLGNWLSGEYSISELAQAYGVSRPTIYKWIGRYESEGLSGLLDRSRAARLHPNATSDEVAASIVELKQAHPDWGPRKLVRLLKDRHPEQTWPSDSTAATVLRRAGLVKPRRPRRRAPGRAETLRACDAPMRVVSADFKGQFRTGDGQLCYPLTVSDNFSRYLLLCQGLKRPTFAETQPWLERVFREYGLPEALRTDNGAPFASVGLGGLSRLAIWLIKLGVVPERIAPGHPEQNGRHERMHRTLKAATIKPAGHNLQAQQIAFDKFRQEYNLIRPHEAIDLKPPATCFQPSPRPYPDLIAPVEYDISLEVRRVRTRGEIKFNGNFVYISEALHGESVSLEQIDDHLWDVRFSFHLLGRLNDQTGKVEPLSWCSTSK